MKKAPLHSIDEGVTAISILLKNLYITKASLTKTHENVWGFPKLVKLIEYEDPQSRIYHCLISVHR